MTSVCPAAGVGGSPSAMVVSSFVASPQSPQAVTEDSCSTPSPRPGPQLSQFAAVVPTPLGEVRVQASLSEVAFLGVGDQDAAIRVTATLTFGHGQFPASGDIVAVRRGGTVILVINAAAVQADTGLTQSIVRKGSARNAAAGDGPGGHRWRQGPQRPAGEPRRRTALAALPASREAQAVASLTGRPAQPRLDPGLDLLVRGGRALPPHALPVHPHAGIAQVKDQPEFRNVSCSHASIPGGFAPGSLLGAPCRRWLRGGTPAQR